MRRPLLTTGIAAVVVTVVLGASALLSGLDAAAETRSERLDELHARRPAAAASSRDTVLANAVEQTALGASFAEYARDIRLANVLAYLRGLEQARPTRRVVTSGSSGGGDFLSCTRQRESSGNYAAVSSSGAYRGAYQFMQSTWDRTALSSGRTDLVGVDPAQAAAADQDAMATSLYQQQGSAPWGGRC